MNIIKEIKKLNFPPDQYVIVGSGTMSAFNIRESEDIDIAVTPELFKTLEQSEEWQEKIKYGKIFLEKGVVEIIAKLNWKDYQTTTEQAIKSAIIVEGIPFMNFDELKKFKTTLGREKDFEDIKLIDDYLKSIQNS